MGRQSGFIAMQASMASGKRAERQSPMASTAQGRASLQPVFGSTHVGGLSLVDVLFSPKECTCCNDVLHRHPCYSC